MLHNFLNWLGLYTRSDVEKAVQQKKALLGAYLLMVDPDLLAKTEKIMAEINPRNKFCFDPNDETVERFEAAYAIYRAIKAAENKPQSLNDL